ncbi:MAG TPA: FAD-binding oxidoreductase [Trebonia sp.]
MNSTTSLSVHRPGDAAYDAACAGFDLSAVPTPDLAVSATSEADVAAAVRYAADRDLPISVRATGHGTVPLADRGVLIDTRGLSSVTVDAGARTAVVGAGVKWTRVLAESGPLGLSPLCGSSSDVGAVGYTLGGGLGPLGRRHGWSADHVRRFRLGTAAGEVREVSADTDPELFWGLRGGGGGFGVVTEMEIDLEPAADLYGGALYLPGEAAPEVLAEFARATAAAPDELSLSVAFLTFPGIDAVPAPLRGRFVSDLRVTYQGDRGEAEALIAPFRAIASPLLDTVRPLPITELSTVHNDPVHPQPVRSGSAVLPQSAGEVGRILLDEIRATTPYMLEVRHLGGALVRPAGVDNAVGHRAAPFSLFTSAYPGPKIDAAADLQAALYRRLAPWTGGRVLYNFAAGPVDLHACFDEPTATRLRALKQDLDPQNLLRYTVATIL